MKRKGENINLIVVCMIYGNISTVPVCAVLPWLPPALESQTFDFTILIMVMMMRMGRHEDNDYDDGDDDDHPKQRNNGSDVANIAYLATNLVS